MRGRLTPRFLASASDTEPRLHRLHPLRYQLLGRTARLKAQSVEDGKSAEKRFASSQRRECAVGELLAREGDRARAADEHVRRFASEFKASADAGLQSLALQLTVGHDNRVPYEAHET